VATFQAQVMALTGINISSSSTNPTEAQLTQYLTDGAKEVINHLPKHLLPLCSAEQSFTSGTPDTLNTGKVLNVFRNDGDIKQPCRQIDSSYKGRVLDSDDMDYASVTDPVYYIENNTMDVIPNSGAVTYSEVQHPDVVYSADSILIFPDEAEYLVPLYASVKSLQSLLANKSGNTNITTAFALLKAAVDQAETAANKFESSIVDSVFGDEDTFITASSQLARVKAALDDAEDVINGDEPSATTDAYGAQANEDIELVSSAINIAQSEIRRAQAHLQEWVAIGDMRVKEVNAALSEAQGYASEIQSRLAVDSTEYSWYEKQQAKLQSDYDRGLSLLKGGAK
tara:strand:- start:1040 stop:2062 length:1023 start_codon:yes stop_codon:yes gene_type:complete